MADNKTLAFWCEKADGAGDTSAEFHVNLWHFSSKKHSDFVEVGIMSDNPGALSCIRIYIPFVVDHGTIEDLGPKFSSTEIAQGIFNEALSSTQSPSGKFVELRDGKDTYCQVHIFSPNGSTIDADELVIKPKADGTLITITESALMSLARQSETTHRGYFRLRIFPKVKNTRPFVTTIKPVDRIWNSGFDQIDYIDCRINEARTLPTAVESAALQVPSGIAAINRIVFLAVVPVVSSVTSSHAQWHKSRLLESEIWENYVPQELENAMVVYHWRKKFTKEPKKPLQGFSAFVKMQTRKSDRLIVLLYIFTAFIFGILVRSIGNYVHKIFM